LKQHAANGLRRIARERNRLCLLSACLLGLTAGNLQAEDDTFVYAVQISATVQTAPPQITLQWQPDPYGANTYTVYRKAKSDNAWGSPIAVLSGSISNYTDTTVSVGAAFEYQIIKAATLGYKGYGYIYAGISAPLTESRGTLILITATESTASLTNELARLQADLAGDGWFVIRHDVSSADTPASVRSLITNDYYADPANVKSVFLLGHVPILHSGNLNYDGHLARPMPADAYYGDVDGDWSANPDYLPSDVELMVGRVDLFNMPGNGAPVPWPNEVELLRNYLNKDHNWRHKLVTAQRRALMGDLRGAEGGEATSTSGYRNFEPLIGPGNTINANVDSGLTNRWISNLGAGSFLWAYGCGAGQPYACSGLGTNDGTFYDVWSTDVVGQNAQAVFVMLFGSWFGNWDDTDDLLRSVLATPTLGLTACIAGRPHWYVHHMGLGEPIGYSTRVTMNNSTLYQNQTNLLHRAIFISLMGDPTLRQDQVAPPSNLTATANSNTVSLSWSASPDSVLGYHVYRSTSPAGPFSRLTSFLLTNTSFQDPNLPSGAYTYMVRSVKFQTTPSGTYYNPSQGIAVSANLTFSPPITLLSTRSGNGLVITWNSQPGTLYHVQSKDALTQANWTILSASITASGFTSAWTDTNFGTRNQRFYRISSP